MKKLLVLILVFGTASMAVAVPVLRVDPADVKDNYYASDVITIQLYDKGAVRGIAMDAITDYGCGGVVFNETFNSAFDIQWPGQLNADGMLLEYTAALTTTSNYATGVLYSFEYHVPSVPFSTMITITTYNDGGNIWYPAEVDYADGSAYICPPELAVTIHKCPEPTTIAFLGLGGLMLRRKR